MELATIAEIVGQQQRRLKVWFARVLTDGELCEPPSGARIVERTAETVDLAYLGSVDAIVKWLARYPVDRVSTPQTSLEEAFIQYYSNGQEDT